MISTQHEIERLINNKFMTKIQPTTITSEIQCPDIYDNYNDTDIDKNIIDKKDSIQNLYNYLHDETLHKVIEPTSNTEYHYVLYNILDLTAKPFVKILMYNSNNIMKFPNEKATTENNDESETDSESSDILPFDDDSENSENIDEFYSENDESSYVIEQCSQYLEKNFGIDYEKSNDNYKGYVKVEDKLYIFIDVSAIELIFPENEVFSWVIIDEIINKKVSNNIPICDIITNMFSTNNSIKNIYDENNEIIEYPICVYLCKKENGEEYINVESKSSTNMSLMSDKIEHPIFGNTTMFSTERINIDDKILKRYCLFTTDAIYVLHSNFTKYEVGLINNKSCIRFLQKTNEYWSVKNASLYLYI